jgi:hypothetical protein
MQIKGNATVETSATRSNGQMMQPKSQSGLAVALSALSMAEGGPLIVTRTSSRKLATALSYRSTDLGRKPLTSTCALAVAPYLS